MNLEEKQSTKSHVLLFSLKRGRRAKDPGQQAYLYCTMHVVEICYLVLLPYFHPDNCTQILFSAGVGKLQPKSGPPPDFVNKVLFVCNHAVLPM